MNGIEERTHRGYAHTAVAAGQSRDGVIGPRPEAPSPSAKIGVATWCARMLKGLRCRWRLDRRDASLMVHILDDYGDRSAAIEACKQVVKRDPQNVHGYLNMIDMVARGFGDLHRADKYRDLGLATLQDLGDRDLLLSFHLYTSTLSRQR